MPQEIVERNLSLDGKEVKNQRYWCLPVGSIGRKQNGLPPASTESSSFFTASMLT